MPPPRETNRKIQEVYSTPASLDSKLYGGILLIQVRQEDINEVLWTYP